MRLIGMCVTIPPALRCAGRSVGEGRCCTAAAPCVAGEGDCDGDGECGPGLVCGDNNCRQVQTGAGVRNKENIALYCAVWGILPRKG